MPLEPKTVFEQLGALFPEYSFTYDETSVVIGVSAEGIKAVCLQLRDAPNFAYDYLMCLSGVDNADGTLSSVYNLYSTSLGHKLNLKVTVPKDNPVVPSVERVWRTADWHERESFDLIGIVYDGHRDLRRILCPYDWEGHPLRKDYEVPEFYNGIKVPY